MKVVPSYKAVDEKIKPYVDEFIELSAQNNIVFDRKVTIGLTKIERGDVIGTCYYALGFREIDIDMEFFESASEIRKKALIFHELAHCYCKRGHDWAEGQDYPNGLLMFIKRIQNNIPWCLSKDNPGYLEDGCSSSLMHPIILGTECLQKHWDHYTKEMFDRCDPY